MRTNRTACPFRYYAVRRTFDPYMVERLPEPPVAVEWRTATDCGARGTEHCRAEYPDICDACAARENERPTLGERLFPGCECGAAARGEFDRCTCD